MFCFDIETLGIESTAVILSAAIIEWEPEEEFTYSDLIKRAVFVKFDALEQVRKFKRTTDRSTREWWDKQSEHAKKLSLIPNADMDVSVEEGVAKLRGVVKNSTSKNKTMWVRGSLDQLAIDSLTRVAEVSDVAHFTSYRDVRTAVDILVPGASGGYCNIPGFDRSQVQKHDPVHDCAYDIMMMRYGE